MCWSAPCTAMAGRITAALPDVADRLVVRMHPVSASSVRRISVRRRVPRRPDESLILCPVLFAPYKHMADRIAEWLAAVDGALDDSVRMIVTASAARGARDAGGQPAAALRRDGSSVGQMNELWARSRAVYFPTGLESFGCPLAEARVNGKPVIARDTAQNREIAGSALCGFILGDPDSLRQATEAALTAGSLPTRSRSTRTRTSTGCWGTGR